MALVAPQGQVTPAGVIPRLKQFNVAGIFEVGMFEYDSGLALVHLEDAQKLFQMGNEVSGLRLRLDDLFAARGVSRTFDSLEATQRLLALTEGLTADDLVIAPYAAVMAL